MIEKLVSTRLGARVLLASAMVVLSIARANAQDERARTTTNPVGDILSVPFEFNFNGGGGLVDQKP